MNFERCISGLSSLGPSLLRGLGVAVLAWSGICRAAVEVSLDEAGGWKEFAWNGRSILRKEAGLPWRLVLYDRKEEKLVHLGEEVPEGYSIRLLSALSHEARWKVVVQGTGGAQSVANVRVAWSVQDRRAAETSFEATAEPERYEVVRFSYPVVPLVASAMESVVLPLGLGQRYSQIDKKKEKEWGAEEERLQAVVRSRYPSRTGTLQLQLLERPGQTLLCYTPDRARQTKDFVIHHKAGKTSLVWSHYPHTSRGVERPYPVVFEAIAGDWYDAAQRYRRWALQQPWGRQSIVARNDIPAWFRDLPSWLRVTRGPGLQWKEKADWPRQWADAVGGPLGVHWYGWDELGGPNEYRNPASYPPRAELLEKLPEYEARGIYIMPYLNTRVVSKVSPLWEKYEPALVKDRKGHPAFLETWWDYCDEEMAQIAIKEGRPARKLHGDLWYAPFHFAIGDPGNPLWRENVVVRNLEAVDYGFPAVYQDQLNADPLVNHDSLRPPSAKSATAWHSGVEAIYEELHQKLGQRGKKIALIGEYLGENLIPSVHGGLTVGRGVILSGEHLPLFPAIYHTHFFAIGWPDNPHDIDTRMQRYGVQQPTGAPAHPELYFHQRMVPLIYGSQIGWISYVTPKLIAEYPELVAAYREAVKVRKRFPEFLGYGKLLRPPLVHLSEERLLMKEEPELAIGEQRAKPVIAGLFQSAHHPGKALAIFVNWTREVQTTDVSIDVSELAGRSFSRERVDALEHRPEPLNPGARWTLSLPPYGLTAYLIESHE